MPGIFISRFCCVYVRNDYRVSVKMDQVFKHNQKSCHPKNTNQNENAIQQYIYYELQSHK